MFMSHCYVCLEACEQKSPCECKMYVHENCLAMAHAKMPRNDCSVCRSPIVVKHVELDIPPPKIYQIDVPYSSSVYVSVCFVVYLFTIYILFGWIGQLFLMACGFQTVFPVFWVMGHLFSFLGTIIIFVCVYNLLRIGFR
jgi:hypothetical protein